MTRRAWVFYGLLFCFLCGGAALARPFRPAWERVILESLGGDGDGYNYYWDSGIPPDTGFDDAGNPIDAGFYDSGEHPDAIVDTGFDDAGVPVDSGIHDDAAVDSGVEDMGVVDASFYNDYAITCDGISEYLETVRGYPFDGGLAPAITADGVGVFTVAAVTRNVYTGAPNTEGFIVASQDPQGVRYKWIGASETPGTDEVRLEVYHNQIDDGVYYPYDYDTKTSTVQTLTVMVFNANEPSNYDTTRVYRSIESEPISEVTCDPNAPNGEEQLYFRNDTLIGVCAGYKGSLPISTTPQRFLATEVSQLAIWEYAFTSTDAAALGTSANDPGNWSATSPLYGRTGFWLMGDDPDDNPYTRIVDQWGDNDLTPYNMGPTNQFLFREPVGYCEDSADNDNDGLTDCDDPDCDDRDPVCVVPPVQYGFTCDGLTEAATASTVTGGTESAATFAFLVKSISRDATTDALFSIGANAWYAAVDSDYGDEMKLYTEGAIGYISYDASDTTQLMVLVYDGTQALQNDRLKAYVSSGSDAMALAAEPTPWTTPSTTFSLNQEFRLCSLTGPSNYVAVTIGYMAVWESALTLSEAQELGTGDVPTNWDTASTASGRVSLWTFGDDPADDPTSVINDQWGSNDLTPVNMDASNKVAW